MGETDTRPRAVLHLVVCAFVCAALLAGCNVFDGLGDEGDSGDPNVLLQDARAALSRGEPQVAVQYLDRAYSIDPSNPEVRIELAGARFAQAEVDLLTLRELVTHINGDEGSVAPATLTPKQDHGPFCTFDADRSGLEEFDYTSAPAYQAIREEIATFEAARELLDGIRSAAFSELPEETRAQWYLARAFTRTALAIDAINREVERIEATLYRLPSVQNSIGICAASEQALSRTEVRIKCDHLPQIVVGLEELEIRNWLLDDADVSGVLDDLRQAVDVVGAQLDSDVIRFCSTNAVQ